MQLSELGWPDVEAYLTRDDRIILPVGSTEQHGRHLPLGTDALVAASLADRVSRASGVVAAPVLPAGMAMHHLAFPGSIALKPGTLTAVVTDVVESLYGHGFRRFLIINGHGGNIASIDSALPVLMTRPDLFIKVSNWWKEEPVAAIARQAFGGSGHSSADETSAVLALRPELVHLERAGGASSVVWSQNPKRLRELHPDGNAGPAPALATAEIGEAMLSAAVEVCVRLLAEW